MNQKDKVKFEKLKKKFIVKPDEAKQMERLYDLVDKGVRLVVRNKKEILYVMTPNGIHHKKQIINEAVRLGENLYGFKKSKDFE